MSAVCFPYRRSISIRKIKNIFVASVCVCVFEWWCAVCVCQSSEISFGSFLTPKRLFLRCRSISVTIIIIICAGSSPLVFSIELIVDAMTSEFVVCLRLRISCTQLFTCYRACTYVVDSVSTRKTFILPETVFGRILPRRKEPRRSSKLQEM